MTEEQKKVVSDMLDTIQLLEQQNKQLIEAMNLLRTQAWEYTLSIKLAKRMTETIDTALQQIQGKE